MSNFCSICGTKASGNFCSNCGHKLKQKPVAELSSYEEVIGDERCRLIIKKCIPKREGGIGPQDYIDLMDALFPAAAVAKLGEILAKKTGLESNEFAEIDLKYAHGYILTGILCAMAKHNVNVTEIQEGRTVSKFTGRLSNSFFRRNAKIIFRLHKKGKSDFELIIQAQTLGQYADMGNTRMQLKRLKKDVSYFCSKLAESKL